MTKLLLKQSIVSFPDRNWESIKSRCKGRSGVYAFICNVNNKYYIGSAVDLYNRLRDYHQPWYLAKHASDVVVRAINKHGMDNFTIAILEYTTIDGTVSAEQVWIDTFKPVYNVLTKAGSSLGYQHTDENKLKISKQMTGKTRSKKVRDAIAERQLGYLNTFYGKSHTQQAKALIRAAALARDYFPKPGYPITIVDTHTNITSTYKSLRAAAKALQCNRPTLQKYNGQLFRERYVINIINNVDNKP